MSTIESLIEYIDKNTLQTTYSNISSFKDLLNNFTVIDKTSNKNITKIIKYLCTCTFKYSLFSKYHILIADFLDKLTLNNNLGITNIKLIFKCIQLYSLLPKDIENASKNWLTNIRNSNFEFTEEHKNILFKYNLINDINFFKSIDVNCFLTFLKNMGNTSKQYVYDNKKIYIDIIKKNNFDFPINMFNIYNYYNDIDYYDTIIDMFIKAGIKIKDEYLTLYYKTIFECTLIRSVNIHKSFTFDHITNLFKLDFNFNHILDINNPLTCGGVIDQNKFMKLYSDKYSPNITENNVLHFIKKHRSYQNPVLFLNFVDIFKFDITSNIIKHSIMFNIVGILNTYTFDKYSDVYSSINKDFIMKYGCIHCNVKIIEIALNKKIIPDKTYVEYCLSSQHIDTIKVKNCLQLMINYGLYINDDIYKLFCRYYNILPDNFIPIIDKERFYKIYNDNVIHYTFNDIYKLDNSKPLSKNILNSIFKKSILIEQEYLIDMYNYIPDIETILNLENKNKKKSINPKTLNKKVIVTQKCSKNSKKYINSDFVDF